MPRKRDRQDRFFRRRTRRPEAHVILVPELIGTVLALHRRRARMRQVDLADDLDWPQSLVSKLERGDINLSVDQLDAITEAIAVELSGDEGDASQLRPWEVLRQVDRIAEELMDEGYDLVWSPGPSYERPEELLRGRVLVERVREALRRA